MDRTGIARVGALGLTLAVLSVGAGSATAHVNPPGCGTSGLHMQLNGLQTIKRNGDVVPVTASVGNDNGSNQCDITDATVTLEFPAADGSPGGTPETVVLATHADYPAGKRALKPGSYRASLTAKDPAGNASKVKRLSFRIVRR